MRLSEDQVAQYFEDGFLIVEDVFTADELRPVMDEFEDIVDEWAERLYAAGKIGDRLEGEDLYTRLASLEKEWSSIAPLIHNREQTRPRLAARGNQRGVRHEEGRTAGPVGATAPRAAWRVAKRAERAPGA